MPDALSAARFELIIDGHSMAQFTELAEIAAEAGPVEFIETGPDLPILKQLPGKRRPPTLILRRPRGNDTRLLAWYHASAGQGRTPVKKLCTLAVYNTDGKPVARYHLTDAWPSKLEIGGLKAGSSPVLMETVTMTCEFIQRVSV
jgi:phage tail-like protein